MARPGNCSNSTGSMESPPQPRSRTAKGPVKSRGAESELFSFGIAPLEGRGCLLGKRPSQVWPLLSRSFAWWSERELRCVTIAPRSADPPTSAALGLQ